jgi:hypothetical protein
MASSTIAPSAGELAREDVAGLLGADDQDAEVFDGTGGLEGLDDGLGDVLGGLEINLEMEVADAGGGGGADGGDADSADVAGVVVEFEEEPEEGVHAIGTGEDDPIVAVAILDEMAELDEFGGSTMRMVGISQTSAPRARRPEESAPACLRVRVTTMRLPKRGRDSNQLSVSRSWTTWPKTAMAGAEKPVSATRAAMVSRRPRRVCWRPVVAQRMRATGRAGSAPCGEEGLGNGGDALDAHEHDLRAGLAGDGGVVEGRRRALWGLRGR